MFREFDVETTNNMYFLMNYSTKICIKYHDLWYFHNWGTQKECLTSKSLSKHYFEWPLHLQNTIFNRLLLFINIHILFD